MFKTILCRFPGFFNQKTTFEECEEICKQIHIEEETQYNDEKETIDSNIYLLTKELSFYHKL